MAGNKNIFFKILRLRCRRSTLMGFYSLDDHFFQARAIKKNRFIRIHVMSMVRGLEDGDNLYHRYAFTRYM